VINTFLKSDISPKRFGPWETNHITIQPEKPIPPCKEECIADYPHCINSVSIENVMEAVEKLLSSDQIASQSISPNKAKSNHDSKGM